LNGQIIGEVQKIVYRDNFEESIMYPGHIRIRVRLALLYYV
jgi:hypothetical protein